MGSKWHQLIKLWDSLQVELHGRYSAERVVALAKYSRVTSWLQVFLVLLVTPLPCLAVTVLVDVIPLADPAKGLEANKMFFVREFYTNMVVTFLATNQFRMGVPALPYPLITAVLNTIVISICMVAILYGVATMIGFPVPFSLMSMTTPWVTLISITIGIEWTKKIRENPGSGTMVLNVMKVWMCEVMLVGIYPPYFYVFTTLSSAGQMMFAVLLPMIKIFMRNTFVRTVVHLRDELPEVVVCNVEVFNALFVSYCMQNSPSIWTTMELMLADFLLLSMSLHDAEKVRRGLGESERRLDLHSNNTKNLDRRQSTHGDAITTLERVELLLQEDLHPEVTLVLPFVELQAPDNAKPDKKKPKNYTPDLHPVLAVKQGFGQSRVHPAMNSCGSRKSLTILKSRYTRKVQRLLYMAEFLLLLNYVEVIIPLVFSIYLAAMYQLPNRNYYAQITGMESSELLQTLKNVLFYCSLQFISLLVLLFALQRKLGLSPVHQLSFVLEKQYAGVQTKLIFWVYYNVQASLKHQGYDYTFRFPWLQHDSNSTSTAE